jgi:ribosomal protein S18 acetylase RimI-like enzyme
VFHRRDEQGVGQKLVEMCEHEFQKHGVIDVHTWANTTSPIVHLMNKNGYAKGHEYIWMDKKL